MSKTLFLLFLLLNACYLEDHDNVRVFEIEEKQYNGDEIKIRYGEIFALKFYSNPSTGYSMHYLNKDEVNNSISYLTSKYVSQTSEIPVDGLGGHEYFYFKGVKVTNETQTLNFSYSRGKKENALIRYSVKISVY